MNTYIISINSVEKETEKAMLINCQVSWGEGNLKQKSIWMPKSVIVRVSEKIAEVKDWFILKAEQANSFNGYTMSFERN